MNAWSRVKANRKNQFDTAVKYAFINNEDCQYAAIPRRDGETADGFCSRVNIAYCAVLDKYNIGVNDCSVTYYDNDIQLVYRIP